MRPIRPVFIQVTPSEIFNPCTDTVDLIATITSGDYHRHTFLWELLSGAQVIFTTPTNQLTASCSLMGVATDRIFRFWLDKDRSTEQFFDLEFWGTITEKFGVMGSNLITTDGLFIRDGSPLCASIRGVQGWLGSTSGGASVVNPNNIMLLWDLPVNQTGLALIQVEQNIGGIWTTILSILPSDPQVLQSASQDTYYRIKTIYKINNQLYGQYSCVYYLLIDTSTLNCYVDEMLLGMGNRLSVDSVTNFSLLTTDSVTNELDEYEPLHGGNRLSVDSVTNFSLLTTDSVTNELDESEPLHGGNRLVVTNVTYLGGIVIGGG
jgi:hypothetical protein